MQKLEGVYKIEQVIVSYRPSLYFSVLSPHYNTLLLFITISLSIIDLLPLTPEIQNSIDQKYTLYLYNIEIYFINVSNVNKGHFNFLLKLNY